MYITYITESQFSFLVMYKKYFYLLVRVLCSFALHLKSIPILCCTVNHKINGRKIGMKGKGIHNRQTHIHTHIIYTYGYTEADRYLFSLAWCFETHRLCWEHISYMLTPCTFLFTLCLYSEGDFGAHRLTEPAQSSQPHIESFPHPPTKTTKSTTRRWFCLSNELSFSLDAAVSHWDADEVWRPARTSWICYPR